MKKNKSIAEHIAFSLHQAQTGKSVEEVCRKVCASQAAFTVFPPTSHLPTPRGR